MRRPDGGDGGRGGNVVVTVDDHMSTLMDFRYKRKYTAANGTDGGGKRCTGRNGADLVLRVPGAPSSGTPPPRRSSTICRMTPLHPLQGAARGGWGNQHFATPPGRSPLCQGGLPGEAARLFWN